MKNNMDYKFKGITYTVARSLQPAAHGPQNSDSVTLTMTSTTDDGPMPIPQASPEHSALVS